MKRKYLFGLGSVFIVGEVLIFTLLQVGSGSGARTPTPSGLATPGNVAIQGLPTPEVTDLAPEVATRDKLEIVIRHPNGRRDYIFLALNTVDAFIDQLPTGDTVVDIIPPESQVGHEPPTIIPDSGNQAYSGTPGTAIGTLPSEP